MPNRHELRKARRDAQRAALTVELIEALPRRVGSTVEWDNGVIWRRVGDDAWVPLHDGRDGPEPWVGAETWPSAHVATGADALLPRRLL